MYFLNGKSGEKECQTDGTKIEKDKEQTKCSMDKVGGSERGGKSRKKIVPYLSTDNKENNIRTPGKE